jgi:hypothetical protein
MTKKLIIDVDNKGGMTIEATGYTGPSCSVEVGRLRGMVGGDVDDKKKPEYHNNTRSDIHGQGG